VLDHRRVVDNASCDLLVRRVRAASCGGAATKEIAMIDLNQCPRAVAHARIHGIRHAVWEVARVVADKAVDAAGLPPRPNDADENWEDYEIANAFMEEHRKVYYSTVDAVMDAALTAAARAAGYDTWDEFSEVHLLPDSKLRDQLAGRPTTSRLRPTKKKVSAGDVA
jgi:hypothetical protein